MKKGFTLIEMLIVVLIIGILAAIALPRYQLAVKKTKIMKAVAELPAIFSALDRYRLANGSFPVISDAVGPAAVAELNDALDIDIPNLNGFSFIYYTS